MELNKSFLRKLLVSVNDLLKILLIPALQVLTGLRLHHKWYLYKQKKLLVRVSREEFNDLKITSPT